MPERYTIKPYIFTSKSGRNVSKVTGEAIVYIRVTTLRHGETSPSKYIPTLITVKPQDFNKKEGKVKRSDPNNVHKNTIIFNKQFLIQQDIRNVEEGKLPSSEVAEIFIPPTKTFLDYVDVYIEFRKAGETPYGTLKEFKTLKNRLLKYEEYAFQKLNFKEVSNLRFSDQFYIYLKSKYSAGTIEKTYTILRTILNHFYKRKEDYGIIITDKFRMQDWKHGIKSINEPNPLSEDEVKTLINHKFDKVSLQQHQDRFLFQCSTGCRYGDIFSITKENIIKNCIEYYPHKTIRKTDNKVIVGLTGITKKILKKYGYDMRVLNISNQKYNEGLTEMFTELKKKYPKKFKDTYTSHNGRDTFITLAINSDVDVPSLLKMVGQNSWTIMRRYYKVDRERIIEKIKKIKVLDV